VGREPIRGRDENRICTNRELQAGYKEEAGCGVEDGKKN
jgi:hypothetical protein